MKLSTKIIIALLVLTVAGIGLAATYLPVYDVDVSQVSHEAYVGEITGDVLVGQTFVANQDNLAAVSIFFSSFSAKDNTQPVYFYLRESVNGRDDIRSGEVSPSQLDEGFFRFEFEPILNSKGKEYFFYIISPDSTAGNAVTIGASNGNLYEDGAAYIVRNFRADAITPDIIRPAVQFQTDLTFKAHYYAPLRVAVINNTIKGYNLFIDTWQDNLPLYIKWTKIVLPALLLMGLLILLRQSKYDKLVENHSEVKVTLIFLSLLFFLGCGLRIMYALELPLTSDEGRYLYDAKTVRDGVLAGGDAYVKAPLVIGWIALWQYLIGENTIFAGRLASALISALTIFPIYFIAKYLWDRRVALVAASLWSLLGIAAMYGMYIHTQPLAIFFVTSAIAALCVSLRRDLGKKQLHLIVIAGILMALALLSRKSVLALSALPLALILIEAKAWRRLTYLIAFSVGVLLVLLPALWLVDTIYGDHGVWEALGIYSIEDGLSVMRNVSVMSWYRESVSSMWPLLQQALPLLLLFGIGLGLTGEKFLRSGIKTIIDKFSLEANSFVDHVVPKIMWFFPLAILSLLYVIWFRSGREASAIWGMDILWITLAVTLLLFIIWPRPSEEKIVKEKADTIVPYSTQPNVVKPYPGKRESTQTMALKPLLNATFLIPLWLLGLVAFYINWIKFNADYMAEFVPPLILLGAIGGAYLIDRLRRSPWLRKKYPGVSFLRPLVIFPVIVVLLLTIIASNYITYTLNHSGIYDQAALEEAAAWAKVNIPKDEYIFTGAPIVPYLSGHKTMLDIAHTGWYSYMFTQSNQPRLNTFLPTIDQVIQSFNEANWVLVEERTILHLIEPYAAIKNGLENSFVPVKVIDNMDSSFIFYERQ